MEKSFKILILIEIILKFYHYDRHLVDLNNTIIDIEKSTKMKCS